MKVLTFSRFFPKGHIREGEPTYFVEKISKSVDQICSSVLHVFNDHVFDSCNPKLHTIRMGQRWKVGDDISFRVWSDKPYRSKQIEFLTLKVKNIWNIQIFQNAEEWRFYIDGDFAGSNVYKYGEYTILTKLAKNDGLSVNDFLSWFKPNEYPFQFAGQIISWSDDVNYNNEI